MVRSVCVVLVKVSFCFVFLWEGRGATLLVMNLDCACTVVPVFVFSTVLWFKTWYDLINCFKTTYVYVDADVDTLLVKPCFD